jgi:hypothetical protein
MKRGRDSAFSTRQCTFKVRVGVEAKQIAGLKKEGEMPRVIVDDKIEINYYVDDFTDPWAEERTPLLCCLPLRNRQIFNPNRACSGKEI